MSLWYVTFQNFNLDSSRERRRIENKNPTQDISSWNKQHSKQIHRNKEMNKSEECGKGRERETDEAGKQCKRAYEY